MTEVSGVKRRLQKSDLFKKKTCREADRGMVCSDEMAGDL